MLETIIAQTVFIHLVQKINLKCMKIYAKIMTIAL